MITYVVIYLLVGLILVSFFMGVGMSQTKDLTYKISWFKFIIILLFYPAVFLILIFEMIGEWFGKSK